MLSVSSQRKYNFYNQNTLLDAFRTNSRNSIGRNPSMAIPLLANQDSTPMLTKPSYLAIPSSPYYSSVVVWNNFVNYGSFSKVSLELSIKLDLNHDFSSCLFSDVLRNYASHKANV